MSSDYEWIIKEPVTGAATPAGTVIRRHDNTVATLTTSPEGRLLIDGQDIDLGEDFVEYLATADEVADRGESEPYGLPFTGPFCAWWTEEEAPMCGHGSCYAIAGSWR